MSTHPLLSGSDAPTAGAPPSELQPVVVAEQATLAYGRNVVLRDVNLRIDPGDFWCFLGPNGEGKTTLIRAILGALRPRRGRLVLRRDFARRTRVGFVPQECDLNPAAPTTVREFIRSGAVGAGLNHRTATLRLQRLLALVGLEPQAARSLWELSGGQRQRAMVARALIRDPLLLVVDEPTAGLDLASAGTVLDIIQALNREHRITIIFVTHDLRIAGRRASHAALFRNGRVQAGPVHEVLQPTHLTETFGLPVTVRIESDGRREMEADRPDSPAPPPTCPPPPDDGADEPAACSTDDLLERLTRRGARP
ncbi:MAG: ABC transporter ATP-binding protein [Verrucomicrobiales bacterium]|nr:ABC transporter ATP-binding protein [Verrucomicrobiales bacterium]MCP5527968.1 ABC transporter ATP-binding protein [Verrucomicrobiales bacterium]